MRRGLKIPGSPWVPVRYRFRAPLNLRLSERLAQNVRSEKLLNCLYVLFGRKNQDAEISIGRIINQCSKSA